MQVETFECPETASEPIEAGEEAIALLEKLGMKGQLELVKPNPVTGVETRCPYRIIREDEMFVYSVICPRKFKPDEYDRSPVPLRVLQVMAHANELGVFKRFEIWDRASSSEKDPVLVAYKEGPRGSWDTQCFILARWGDELETFSVLMDRAVEIQRKAIAAALTQIQVEAAAALTMVASKSPAEIVKRGASIPYIPSLI